MLLNTLNEKQREAVMTTEGPVLMLAGAGSGKTHCLINRVSYLIEKGVSPENILLLTFTNKAAREMLERIEKNIPGKSEKITACTYHSFCVKMLRQYGNETGIDPNFVILDSSDCAEIIGMMKTQEGLNKLKNLPPNKTIVSIISASINKQKSIYEIVKNSYRKYIKMVSYIEILASAVRNYKKENALMDYDDILLEFLSILKTNPEIVDKISKIYRYIMVDEYQDTNILQDAILMILQEKNKNLAVVGDDSQSLYGFRGANVENIIQFPNRIPNCISIPLMQNYRSTQEILDVANYAINHNATEGFKKELVSNNKHGEKPLLVRPQDIEEEAYWVFTQIQNEIKKGIPLNEICVLARNSTQMYFLESLLSKENVSYEKYGGQKFLEKVHIKDILAYLRIISNPKDEISWHRILQLYIGIGPVYAKRLSTICKEQGFYGLSENPYRKKDFYQRIVALEDLFLRWNDEEFHEFLPKIIEHYLDTRKASIINMNTDESTRTELLESIEDIEKDFDIFIYMSQAYNDCILFLDSLSLDSNPSLGPDGDKLVLSTIHSAKGLEFHSVFILDCIDGIFPSTDQFQKGTHEDNEELRCFYVAVTRAKENLYILAPKVGMHWGKVIDGQLTHFLDHAEHLFQILNP